jgi:hypothetical protein
MSRKRDHEKAIFRAFLDLEPEFAGERLAEWEQPEDEREFPDIRAMSGRRFGVELGELPRRLRLTVLAGNWQVTGRDEGSEAGTQRYARASESLKTGLRSPTDANSFRYDLTSWRLKILGPERGVRVRFPPSALNSQFASRCLRERRRAGLWTEPGAASVKQWTCSLTMRGRQSSSTT